MKEVEFPVKTYGNYTWYRRQFENYNTGLCDDIDADDVGVFTFKRKERRYKMWLLQIVAVLVLCCCPMLLL